MLALFLTQNLPTCPGSSSSRSRYGPRLIAKIFSVSVACGKGILKANEGVPAIRSCAVFVGLDIAGAGSDKALLPNESVAKSDTARALPRFRLRSLFDLFQTGIGVADPISCLIDLRWIHWNRSR